MRERRGIRRFSIKTKLLTAFLGVSLVSLVIFGFVAFNGICSLTDYSLQSSRSLGDSAVMDSTIALETQAENYLLGLATDQADISNYLFEKVDSELLILSGLAEELLSKPAVESKPLFSQQQNPSGADASAYHLAPNVTLANVRDELNYTSNMEAAFRAVCANDPSITQLYVGTDSGAIQVYPWLNTIPSTYDPRVRGWYTDAQPDAVSWSTPYLDASGHGLMVTCSVAIEAPQKGYFWVVAADVTLDTLNRNVVNAQIDQLGGYSFLLDNEGNMITRSISGDDSGGNESIMFIPSSELLLGNTTFAEIALNMTQGLMGITMCTFGGGDNYVAYAPLESANWSLAIVLPVSEVIAPALATAARINDTEILVNQRIISQTDSVRNSYIALFVVILVLVVAVSYLLARTIVTPIMTLSKGAKAIGAGDFDARVKVATGDELEALAGSFNKMAENLQEHIAELKRTTAEKERLVKELEIAKGIQQSFLPEKEPEIPGVDIAASNIPAKEVGGDFYDFIPISNDQWGLTIADVSGKGVPAALFMALSRTLVRASTTGNPNIRDGIEKANDLICQDAKTGMFVTLFYAILDSKKKRLKYVNAGHNPPLLLRQPSGKTILLKADGIALGVMDCIKLEEAEVELEKGDVLTLFTDGVTEAINDTEEQFGQARLLRIVQENRALPAKEIVRMVQEAVAAFSGGQPQFDDITLMIIKVL
jgi:sigma-B regulation protein RsbU (phosphoserine phosphatase)